VHAHSHGDYIHSHPSGPGSGQHGHSDDQQTGSVARPAIRRSRRLPDPPPLWSLALSMASLFCSGLRLLVSRSDQEPVVGYAYLVLFGIGTMPE